MSENILDENLTPMQNGEDKTLFFENPEGSYLINIHKGEFDSRITFISEQDLNPVYKKITNPADFFDDNTPKPWQALQAAVGSAAKIYEPEKTKSEDGSLTYYLEIYSNNSSSADFKRGVLEPMSEAGLIPKAAKIF